MTARLTSELAALSALPAVSGDESLVAAHLVSQLARDGLAATTDRIGNVLLAASAHPSVLVTAHMDQVGFMLSRVEGTRAVCLPIGDPDLDEPARAIALGRDGERQPGRLVPDELLGEEGGVVLELAPTDQLHPGQVVAFDCSLVEDGSGCVRAAALDNRIGCWVALSAARRVAPGRPEVAFAWTVREEIDASGALAAARALEPRAVVSVDVTPATLEPPGVDADLRLGDGPAITLRDEGMVADRALLDVFAGAAAAEGLEWQPEVVREGISEAGRIQATLGIPALAVLTVVEDPHAPCSRAHLDDVEQTRDLLVLGLLGLTSHP